MSGRGKLSLSILVVAIVAGGTILYSYNDCGNYYFDEMLNMDPQLLPKKRLCSCEFSDGLIAIESADADVETYGALPIPGTSDQVRCYEHARLMVLANHYAQKYNETVLALVN